jgi:hypothetical protein
LVSSFYTSSTTNSTNIIPGGLWTMNVYSQVNQTAETQYLYMNISYIDNSSNPVLLVDGSTNLVIISTSSSAIQFNAIELYVPTTTLPSSSTLIRVDLYTWQKVGGTNNHNTIIYFNDSTTSHLHTTLAYSEGPTGPTGGFNIAGTHYGDSIFWNGSVSDTKISFGINAGITNQQTNSVAIGNYAGAFQQKEYSIAVGYRSGYTNQHINAVAIGNSAGAFVQGTNSIAIGCNAGLIGQPANSIILNATGLQVDGSYNSATYITPLRQANATGFGTPSVMLYNQGTGEVGYSSVTSATNKTFVIPHPLDAKRYLVHACLEGPEAGVYYRGRGSICEGEESVEVFLPSYVGALAYDFTIQITPMYSGGPLVNPGFIVSDFCKERSSFRVYSSHGKASCAFFWLAHGSRSEVETEPLIDEVKVAGDGPYLWLATFS